MKVQSLNQYPPKYNHQSALRHKEAITAKINKELQAGRIEGPYQSIPYNNYQVSALCAAEKKQPGEYRLIHDLSWPKGDSVNDQIEVKKGKVHYQSMDNVIDTLVRLGPNTNMAIFDIEHAYKVLPIWPEDVPKMGFFWDGAFYFDKTLAMGLRTSAKIFEKFSTAVEWIMKNKGNLEWLHHVLDDFILLTKPPELAEKQAEVFLAICKYLGIPIKVIKLQSGFIVIYLGIELDSVKMEARLPQDKIQKCITKISALLEKDTVRQVDLMSVAGLLNFACKVVRPGRAFLRRVHDSIASVKHKYQFVKVKAPLKADLTTWLTFLENFNGTVLFPESEWLSSRTLHCYTDSSGVGYGLVFGSKWLYGPFHKEWAVKDKNIVFLECYPIILLFELFGPQLRNKKIMLHTDNNALVSIINTQTSKHANTMCLIRKMVLLALEYNILFKAKHVVGKLNTLADPLSRLQLQVFREEAKRLGRTMDELPQTVPEHLLPQNYELD